MSILKNSFTPSCLGKLQQFPNLDVKLVLSLDPVDDGLGDAGFIALTIKVHV